MLLLLNLQHGSIRKVPPHDIGLRTGAFDVICGFDRRPELVEFLELDEVPDLTQWGLNDGGLKDRS